MTGIVLPLSFPGDGERLARVAAMKDVDLGRGGSELADVGVDGHSVPVPLEHPSAVRIGFAEPSRFSAKGSVDGKVESAAPGEKRSGAHFTTAP